MNTNDKIREALELATTIHDGQFRKNGNAPYITHPIAVCEIVKQYINENNDRFCLTDIEIIDIQIIALLHDTCEDCTIMNKQELIQKIYDSFGERVRMCVLQLTKDKSLDNYATYINRLITNGHIFSLLVKFADLKHNMSDLQESPQLDKYRLASMLVSRTINDFANFD